MSNPAPEEPTPEEKAVESYLLDPNLPPIVPKDWVEPLVYPTDVPTKVDLSRYLVALADPTYGRRTIPVDKSPAAPSNGAIPSATL
jgi:hypothetical protein